MCILCSSQFYFSLCAVYPKSDASKEILHLKYSLNEMKVQHDNEIDRMSKEIAEIKTVHDNDVNRLIAEVCVLTEKKPQVKL